MKNQLKPIVAVVGWGFLMVYLKPSWIAICEASEADGGLIFGD